MESIQAGNDQQEEKENNSTPAGFEPAPSKRNRFLICRRNHLAIAPQNNDLEVLINIACKDTESSSPLQKDTTPAGFEPAPSKRNRFLICRRNHLAIAPSFGNRRPRVPITPYCRAMTAMTISENLDDTYYVIKGIVHLSPLSL